MSEQHLLVTKYTIPPGRPLLLQRSRLLGLLDESRSFPLTLLSAPAGFGKTTLLSTWAKQNAASVSWLALEEQDNDAARFWSYVIAALRHNGFSGGEMSLAMLQTLHPAGLESALTSLINELATVKQDIVLVLDDYHLIREQAIHASLQFLLEHLPSRFHLILASRAEPTLPLARFRARSQVLELGEADLRLNNEETGRFLTQIMGLELGAEDIGRLEKRTEGWIAGLQLAALSLRRHNDTATFTQAFTGSHRFILDYVQEEILNPLPEAQQRFLLQTSVLDRINAGLSEALTGEQASQQMLETLERANLFLVPLDEERRWYRFHTLFRDVLLARLQASQPELVPRLHRKAALWYHEQEWPHEAITHALATLDFSFIAELLENYTERLSLQGELKTLLSWLNLLPEEVLLAHPRLATSYILAFNLMFPFPHQEPEERAYLRKIQEGVEGLLQSGSIPPEESKRLVNRILVLKSWDLAAKALSNGNVEGLNSLLPQMQNMPLDDDNMWKLQREGGIAIASRLAGNFRPMVAALQESLRRTRLAQNRYQETQSLWGLVAAHIALGQLRQAQELCQELRQLVESLGNPLPVAAYLDLFQAQLAYEWNRLDDAKSAARRAIEKTAPLQYMDVLMGAYEVLYRVCVARKDLAGAEQAVSEIEQVNRTAAIPLFRPSIEALWVNLWLVRGDLNRAEDWAEDCSYRQEPLIYSRESVYLALARVYLAEQRYTQVLELLDVMTSKAAEVDRVGSLVSILALQVIARQASGANRETLPLLVRLLELTEPEGYLRVFIDGGEQMRRALLYLLQLSRQDISPHLISYAQTLLQEFAGETVTEKPASNNLSRTPFKDAHPFIEPLTSREQEVLRLLAEGATNQEIATRLVVSLATAKKHVASILGKLGADNRTQAIARAREFSLV